MVPIPDISPDSWLFVRHDRSIAASERRHSSLGAADNIAAQKRFGRNVACVAVAVGVARAIQSARFAVLEDDLPTVAVALILTVVVLAAIAPLLGGAPREPHS